MNKFLKILYILSVNLAILILLIFISDLIVFNYYNKTYNNVYNRWGFKYLIKADYMINLETYFDGSNNVYRGRLPDGLEYSSNKPIVLFGCSYTHGEALNYNQTFSYKLAHSLHRPVYNRAIPGHGIQHMYWQTSNKSFYNSVPPADDVFFVIIDHHYFRMLAYFLDVLCHNFNVHYSKKNNGFVLDNKNNYLLNILKSSYTFKLLNIKYSYYYINQPKNAEKLTDEALWFFVKTRENLEKNWNKKFNFTIIFYNDIHYEDLLIKKLKANNFNVIVLSDLTNENLFDKKYFSDKTYHPKEATWDLLTPLIIKKAEL